VVYSLLDDLTQFYIRTKARITGHNPEELEEVQPSPFKEEVPV